MRTKLDEIVEEEFEKAKPEAANHYGDSLAFVKRVASRAAERAFRHGVEQALTKGVDMAWNVQPAPAEEKARVTQVGPAGSFTFTDRRKGERRKDNSEFGQLHRFSNAPSQRIYKIHDGTNLWCVDRRFGKDRRKK